MLFHSLLVQIGLAFQRLVVGGESGQVQINILHFSQPAQICLEIRIETPPVQMLVVMPGFCFYWPDWNRRLVKTLLSNTSYRNPN